MDPKMQLRDALEWAIVEMQSDKPNTVRVKETLQHAYGELFKREHEHDTRKEKLVRLMSVWGDK